MTHRSSLRRLFALLSVIVALVGTGVGGSSAAPSRSEVDAAEARLMELEREFQLAVEEYNLANENLTTIQKRMATTELEVTQLERQMRVREQAAIRLATELYKNGRSLSLEGVLSASSLADLETRVSYLETSTAAQARVFERLAVDRSELDKKLQSLERDRARALVVQQETDELRAQVEAKVAEQAEEVSELRSQLAAAQRRAAEAARAAARAAAPSGGFVGGVSARPAPAPNARAQTAVDAALSQTGKPYQWGAAGPDSYDCSGLTMWAWARAGVALPHNSGMQYAATPRVDRADLAPGDLLFFGSPIHHVGMYIGNGQMVEAPYSGNVVRVVPASRSDFVGAGRPGV